MPCQGVNLRDDRVAPRIPCLNPRTGTIYCLSIAETHHLLSEHLSTTWCLSENVQSFDTSPAEIRHP